MNPNNNGYSADDGGAPLAERLYSDDPSAFPQMDMKQLVEKIQKLEMEYGPKKKKSGASIIMPNNNYKHTMVLMLVTLMILSFCVAGLLLKSCQISEEITKMKTAMEKQISGLKNETRENHEEIKEIAKINGLELYPIANVWIPLDCGEKLNISENGLVATMNDTSEYNNFVRTIWPIQALNFGHYSKTQTTLYYFEVEFLINKEGKVSIGFYTKIYAFFNSIEILDTEGIWIDGVETKFGNVKENFKQGDMVGLGLIHSTTNSSLTKCFATLNGKLLGKADFPSKFATIESIRQLYPTILMYNGGDSFRANFGKQKFRFNLTTEILQ